MLHGSPVWLHTASSYLSCQHAISGRIGIGIFKRRALEHNSCMGSVRGASAWVAVRIGFVAYLDPGSVVRTQPSARSSGHENEGRRKKIRIGDNTHRADHGPYRFCRPGLSDRLWGRRVQTQTRTGNAPVGFLSDFSG